MMKANDLTEIEIEDGDTHITLKRGQTEKPVQQVMAVSPPVAHPPVTQSAQASVQGEPGQTAPGEENLKVITSPIVGTFYAAPSPNAKPFVETGSKINEETVVCIIEAMKVMNEIKSEVNGTIREICVKNGQSVEFGQPLFRVEPD